LCSFGVLGTGIDGGKLPARIGRSRPLRRLTAWTRWQPLRGLPASALFEPRVKEHQPPCRHGPAQEEKDQDGRYGKRRPVRYRRRYGHHAGNREGPDGKRRGGFPFLVHRSPGGRGRAGCSEPGGEVSGDRRHLRVCPRRQGLAHPQAELIPIQPSLHERGLEHSDHLLTVGVRRPQAAMAARACRDLVSWLYHPRYHPHSTMNEA